MQIENLKGYVLYPLVEQGLKVKVNADNTQVYVFPLKKRVQIWKSHVTQKLQPSSRKSGQLAETDK